MDLCSETDLPMITTAERSIRDFSQLPNELVVEILKRTTTPDLLRSCRLVNSIWNEIATAICHRELRVAFNIRKLESSQHDAFQTIFSSSAQNFPWSKCHVYIMQSLSPNILFFLENCGYGIRELDLGVKNNADALQVLKLTPNLEKLYWAGMKMSDESVSGRLQLSELRGQVELLNLKEFRMRTSGGVRTGNDQVLDLILSRVSRLTTIHFSFPTLLCCTKLMESMERLVPSLTKIPTIILDFYHCTLSVHKLLDANCCYLTELHVYFQYLPPDPNYFNPLERLLLLNSSGLKKLSFRCKENYSGHPSVPRLKIPAMTSLKTLEFGDCEGEAFAVQMGMNQNPFVLIVPFSANQFPVLERVHIGRSFNCSLGAFDRSRFDSVKTLWIEPWNYDITETEWGRVFPNLTELKARVNELSLHYVLTHFTHLTKLCLEIKMADDGTDRTLDSILSEIPGRRHSLLNLTCLKHLELDVSPPVVSEIEEYYSLLQIQPLDLLSFKGVVISKGCVQKLGAYHRYFYYK